MKIHFDKLYKDDRIDELCGLGIPFPKGEITDSVYAKMQILDGDKKIPTQSKVTSRWEDGSIRYIFTRFLTSLPGNAKKDLILNFGGTGEVTNPEVRGSVCIEIIDSKENEPSGIWLKNGCFDFKVTDCSERIFDTFSYEGKGFYADSFRGPFLGVKNDVYRPLFEKFKLIESGPIFAVIEGSGKFVNTKLSGEGIKFTIRLFVTAGKPWIDVSFRLFNCTDDTIEPRELTFYVEAPGDGNGNSESAKASDIRTLYGISNYRTKFEEGSKGAEVGGVITAEYLEKEANEHFAEVFYGTFMADVTDRKQNVGVCATIYKAQQNFPKAISTSGTGIKISLIPDQVETNKISKALPVRFESGMAREQRFLLHFHDGACTDYDLNNRSIIYQMPDTPYVDPEVFERAQVMPDIFLPSEKQNDDVEISLIDKADGHARCYGMLCFGDAPDPGYTAQGRGNGDLVWTNNEYDYPHAMYMMYARTGIRRMLDYGNTAVSHWMDVDICHYSANPLYVNGQWEHTRRHNGGTEDGTFSRGIMACSHEWVEGLLDYYHFTGDERALDAAIGIGDNVLGLLDTPEYQGLGEISARETGWALRSLTALYVETHDEKWKTRQDWIVEQFAKWKEKYGSWLAAYTDNTTIRVGFMISVAIGSLMRYYRVCPSDRLKELIIWAVDDLTENCVTPHGLFYYKELPSLSRNGNNTLLLESMAIGYELTGDRKYLEYGIKTFKKAINSVAPGAVGGKRITEDTLIVGSGAPKAFAQSFLPLAFYYTKAAKEDLI